MTFEAIKKIINAVINATITQKQQNFKTDFKNLLKRICSQSYLMTFKSVRKQLAPSLTYYLPQNCQN